MRRCAEAKKRVCTVAVESRTRRRGARSGRAPRCGAALTLRQRGIQALPVSNLEGAAVVGAVSAARPGVAEAHRERDVSAGKDEDQRSHRGRDAAGSTGVQQKPARRWKPTSRDRRAELALRSASSSRTSALRLDQRRSRPSPSLSAGFTRKRRPGPRTAGSAAPRCLRMQRIGPWTLQQFSVRSSGDDRETRFGRCRVLLWACFQKLATITPQVLE
jgi:hypothetical protein